MKVKVKGGGVFRSVIGKAGLELDLEDGATAGEAALASGLSTVQIGLIVVNGTRTTVEHVLKEGDQIEFYPFAGGG